MQHGCRTVAFTYNDPVIFARIRHGRSRRLPCAQRQAVAVSAGYMHDQARRDFYAKIDAANVDLKGFSDDFYFKLTSAHLQPVLDTLLYFKHETDVWLEITTLLIPGRTTRMRSSRRCHNGFRELGRDVPLHFSAFHPAHRMLDTPPTPPETLRRARNRKTGRSRLRLSRQCSRRGRRHDLLSAMP